MQVTAIDSSTSATSLYASILGPAFERLSPILKRIHDSRQVKRYAGRCDIGGGTGWIAKLIARFAGLPLAQTDVPLTITIRTVGNGEQWTRMFGAQRMQSRLTNRDQMLEERLGPMVLTFALLAEHERIIWSLRHARLAFLPLPMTWLLQCAASESIQDGRYSFDVGAQVRGIGPIVHYKGWLVEQD